MKKGNGVFHEAMSATHREKVGVGQYHICSCNSAIQMVLTIDSDPTLDGKRYSEKGSLATGHRRRAVKKRGLSLTALLRVETAVPYLSLLRRLGRRLETADITRAVGGARYATCRPRDIHVDIERERDRRDAPELSGLPVPSFVAISFNGEDPGYGPDVSVTSKVRYFVNVFASLHLDTDLHRPNRKKLSLGKDQALGSLKKHDEYLIIIKRKLMALGRGARTDFFISK
ncbi:hypothetical protein ARMSODRAFT_979171 [Armillaria solidipes]|uniref:Uncharacterized protein n=1 Tax=Armillaria solidipes TaxID=1076256 RepID=A0A2H3B3S4_9AGAR|nr:hypothetical protein ARMSODRAFT_979171 [Armillaria solidipes]